MPVGSSTATSPGMSRISGWPANAQPGDAVGDGVEGGTGHGGQGQSPRLGGAVRVAATVSAHAGYRDTAGPEASITLL